MIGLKEFIIAAVMNIGVADVNPQIVVADLTNGVHGATHCSVSEEHGLQCKVWLGKDRIKDKRNLRGSQWTRVENTILHEICHIKAYKVALERDGTIEKIRPHGRDFRNCARDHKVWLRHNLGTGH
tara:strand:- start:1038 stop:1415 length:378 start_codon:yes stop_codon:yes gene_type:complete